MDSDGDDAYDPCWKFFSTVNGGDSCVRGVLMEVCGRWLVNSITFYFLCVFNNYGIDSLIVKTITSDFC